jgi:Flp pilus assembly protein TadD/predicted Ser/Thr protein kinase
MKLMQGARLGPYEIQAAIGAGGMGEVYRAKDTRLGRTVAIKVLPAGVAADPERRRRFEQEARAASALNHPHICVLHDIGSQEGTDFLVMEYLEGQTLAQRLAKGPLPLAEALAYGGQIAGALDSAHRKGIVHRDLKPGNVILTKTGAKLLDFGLAKLKMPGTPGSDASSLLTTPTTQELPVTEMGAILGTLGYMAPEQVEGRDTDARTDLFAFGAVLHEMLTGKRAFTGTSPASVIAAILDRDPPPLSSLLPATPPALDRLVQRCLAKDPDQRWDSARDVADELRWIGETSSGRGTITGAGARARIGRIRRMAGAFAGSRLGQWGLAAAVLVLAAILGWIGLARLTMPALAFKERDFVVVAEVENGTGEPAFDLALKSALEIGLRQSRYVNVLDSNQVQNTLRMMRLSADTRVSPEVGRDVCRRVGAPALVVPRILRAGDAYEIQVALIEASTGRVVDEMRERARGREEVLLHTIDKLTRQLRSRLGESLASLTRTAPPFAQYTTSSLEALQFLELGRRAWADGDMAKAERSFQEALKLDPRFAAARSSLGLILIQFRNRPEEGRKMLAQALQEEGNVSEREYLHLRALNKQFVAEDLQGALDDYRFISELYPDLMPPYNNSGRILERLGRFRDAVPMYERAHKADPRSPIPLWNLWWLAIGRLKYPAVAEGAARALIELQPDNAGAAHALAWSLAAGRRFSEAEDAMRATLKLDPAHMYALPNLGHLQFRRGAAADAAATYQQVLKLAGEGRLRTDLEHLWLCLGLAQAAAGQAAEARRTLLDGVEQIRGRARKGLIKPEDEALIAELLAAAGRRDEARSLAERLAQKAAGTIDVNYELARLWALLGDSGQAIQYLEKAFAAGYADPYMILVDPPLASVRDDPAIERLAPRPSR